VATFAKQDKFNGSVLVARKGEVILEKGYGLKDAKTKTLTDAGTIYQLGSITKQFTAAIILKLVELHQLSLSDKLSKFYPDFPNGDKITITQLLSHTAGVYNYTGDMVFMKTEAIKPSSEEKMLALFKDKPLDFQPGTDWRYSNSGYLLLGYIIQKVTKLPYETVVRKYIFTPLHMQNSGFDFTHLTNPEKATGYYFLTGPAPAEAPVVDSTASFSAGAIYSTTGDLYKWHKALQAGTVARQASLNLAYTPVKNHYGFGWFIDSAYGKLRVGHGGSIFGFTSDIARIPEDDICIILLSNGSNSGLDSITRSLFAILYQQPYSLPVAKQEIQVDSTILKRYVGLFEISPQFRIDIRWEDGRLMAQPTGQQKVQLHAQKDNRFFVKEVTAELEFSADSTGTVNKMILYQGGHQAVGQRVK
jgi:CubicO group peptidase (beta-lactamase class C family)